MIKFDRNNLMWEVQGRTHTKYVDKRRPYTAWSPEQAPVTHLVCIATNYLFLKMSSFWGPIFGLAQKSVFSDVKSQVCVCVCVRVCVCACVCVCVHVLKNELPRWAFHIFIFYASAYPNSGSQIAAHYRKDILNFYIILLNVLTCITSFQYLSNYCNQFNNILALSPTYYVQHPCFLRL